MKKKVIICVSVVCIAVLVVSILFAAHILCIHKWSDATCTRPQNLYYLQQNRRKTARSHRRRMDCYYRFDMFGNRRSTD